MTTFEFVLTYKSGWKKFVKLGAKDREDAWVQLPCIVNLKNVDIVALAVHYGPDNEAIKQP